MTKIEVEINNLKETLTRLTSSQSIEVAIQANASLQDFIWNQQIGELWGEDHNAWPEQTKAIYESLKRQQQELTQLLNQYNHIKSELA